MLRCDVRRAGEVGDRACHLQHAVVCARREVELREHEAHLLLRGGVEPTETRQIARGDFRIAVDPAFARKALFLDFAGGDNARADGGGLLACGQVHNLAERDGRERDLDVDAVEERS